MSFRKRTYAAASSSWGKKGKRGMRKRRRTFKRKSGRSVNQTSKATHGSSLTFRSRKLSRRRFKKLLWNDTILSTHWRSLFAASTTIVTQTNSTTLTIATINPMRPSGVAFWTGAGGLRSTDIGVTPPLFSGDITVRGGMWGMNFRNTSSTLPVSMKLYLGRTIGNPTYSLPASSTTGWDPSIEPDLTKLYGKSYYSTIIQLEPGETWKIERRIGIMKINQYDWQSIGGLSPFVLYTAANVGHSTATTINVDTYFNLSFAADAIGTT